MVKILKEGLLKEDFRRLYGQSIGTKIKHFWNKAWEYHPEIVASLPLALIGISSSLFVHYHRSKDDRPEKYYEDVTIFRPNDPRVADIRKDETLRGRRI